MRRAAVIGLDGATWTVLRPLLEDGTMPNLASLLDRSARGILRSTVPPYTPPAWTSAVTGVNPGRHGVFGFVQGRSEPHLSHWGLVRSPALWQYMEVEGRTTGLFHLPLTYPPPPVSGWAVGAVWMPTGREITGFAHPREVEDRLRSLLPGYAPASGVEVFEDWRDTTLADRIAATVRERFIALADLLEHRPVDVVWAVLEAPDRLHHAYFKYFDPAEPLSRRPAAAEVRRSSTAAFREVDRVVGLLDAYAGEDGVALVCSDHGATGWDGYVFGNQLLAREGLLALQTGARAMRLVDLSGLGSLARRIVPARLSYRIRRRVQQLFDPGRTEAYANRLGTQGFSVNLAGREPNGSVEHGRAAAVLERLEAVLRAARTPSGESLFPSIRRREDVYRGPAAAEAPDLVVEPAGWRWEVSDAMASNELFRRMTDLPLGCHHPDGVLALRAPGVHASEGVRANVVDVLPTLLYAAGAAVPDGLDGEARRDLFGPASPAVVTSSFHPEVAAATEGSPYTRQEEALITKYLTDLGYIG
jgi:predicted AlkP superfamily phosphohydrolase/phosphomutase